MNNFSPMQSHQLTKKTKNSIKKKINMAGKQILTISEILNRVEINGENNCLFTLKDHKDNFADDPQVRLITPAKNELGRISRVILDKINLAIREHFSFNRWKNTQNVIDWFNEIPNKKVHKFVVSDIKKFYPSIKEQLLKEALDFANSYTNIPENDKKIVNHARKSLLLNKQQTWIKKESGLFDVTMGAYAGAEVCELVGSFLLDALSLKYNKTNIGLYRDDGLAVFRNVSGPHFEKIKKEFQKLFRQHGLRLIIKCNLKIVDFLDLTLNLTDSTFKPYHKLNDEICYIHKESNHPPSITKQLPISIEARLSKISSIKKVFNESVSIYQEALDKSVHNHKLKFHPT